MPAQMAIWQHGSKALILLVTFHLGHLHSALLVRKTYANHLLRQLATNYGNRHHVSHLNSKELHSVEDLTQAFPIIFTLKINVHHYFSVLDKS